LPDIVFQDLISKFLRSLNAYEHVLALILVLSPFVLYECTTVLSFTFTAITIRPTGFSLVPPSGPAIPVTAMLAVAFKLLQHPSAISKAHSALTAPFCSSVVFFTFSSFSFISLLYAITEPLNTADAPGMSVIFELIMPPVQDSAVPRESFCSFKR